MELYTFYFCQPTGEAPVFETFQLTDDNDAAVKAMLLLEQHPSSAYVDVWCGEREVCRRRRMDPTLGANLRRDRQASAGGSA